MSKLILFDFRCTRKSCASVFEELAKPDMYWSKCSKCGGNAQRQMSAPRLNHQAMAGSASASPGTIAHFERTHRQQRAKEESCFARNGDYGKAAGSD